MSTEANVERLAGIAATDLRLRLFRANPAYEFVPFDRLPAETRKELGPLCVDPNFFGIVRPRASSGLTAKAVCEDSARLFEFLNQPGRLPGFAFEQADWEMAISRLICDGVLQVEEGSSWRCGSAGLTNTLLASEEWRGALAKLSLQAIRHVAALKTADASEMSACLFRYNTVPITPQWLRRVPDRSALQQSLQIEAGGRLRRMLDQSWTAISPERTQGPWLAWRSRTFSPPDKHTRGYKMYFSPHPSYLREGFQVWLSAITEAGAYHFKIGSDARGQMRPDKMVAYFSEWDLLKQSADRIGKEIADCPAQGVPFTADVGCGALISWGSDPPEDEMAPLWLQHQSWRQWICYRLGSALAVAKHEHPAAIPAWKFALERLRMEGIDVTSWTIVSEAGRKTPEEAIAS